MRRRLSISLPLADAGVAVTPTAAGMAAHALDPPARPTQVPALADLAAVARASLPPAQHP